MAKMTMNGGQINVKWEAGKMVVFDDSFEHEVNKLLALMVEQD